MKTLDVCPSCSPQNVDIRHTDSGFVQTHDYMGILQQIDSKIALLPIPEHRRSFREDTIHSCHAKFQSGKVAFEASHRLRHRNQRCSRKLADVSILLNHEPHRHQILIVQSLESQFRFQLKRSLQMLHGSRQITKLAFVSQPRDRFTSGNMVM